MPHALVFDSGVGGLSVVAKLREHLPDLYLSYAADDEFRPYGDKSEAQLKRRLPELLQSLVLASKPDILVLACNTASTTALTEIRATVEIPVIGVVPAIRPAAQMSKSNSIAVLGTPGTVRRKYVDQLIKDYAADCKVVLHGSTGLVTLAERKLAGETINIESVRAEIAPLLLTSSNDDVDAVVLACTHFPLLAEELSAAAPHVVNWVDSGQAIAKRVGSVLDHLPISGEPNHPQTALIIGGEKKKTRSEIFKVYGFEKTVVTSVEEASLVGLNSFDLNSTSLISS